MPSLNQIDGGEFVPKASRALCERCDGEDRIADNGHMWADSSIVKEKPKRRVTDPQKHMEGDLFIHYRDFSEQSLLVSLCITDVLENGEATCICSCGIGVAAKHLHVNPIWHEEGRHTCIANANGLAPRSETRKIATCSNR